METGGDGRRVIADWDGSLYARHSAHHRAHDRALLAGLAIAPHWRILDVGCGVGDLAARLAADLSDGAVLGVDSSASMVERARRVNARGNVSFAVADVRDLASVAPAGSVDLVVSTAMLHWLPGPEHPVALRQIHRVLRPGGLFRADFGAAGQIAAVRAILDEEAVRLGGSPADWFFPTVGEYAGLLAAAGFSVGDGDVEQVRQRRGFPDAEALTGWLRSQVLVAYEPHLPPETAALFRERGENRALRELMRPDGSYDQDYVRLHVRVSRP